MLETEIGANHPFMIIFSILSISTLVLTPFYMKYKVTKRDGELDPNKSFLENFFSA
ncbi:MAG: hypothetical protein HRT47_13265 [Candidatus Caenarcaniphilales bacterium]|nr:hypothetical protein [Candidatus Caenarcaniphilales bacterium]